MLTPKSPQELSDSKQLLSDRLDREVLEASVKLACDWLINIAQVKTEQLVTDKEQNIAAYPYPDWKGAIRGEYCPSRDVRPPRVAGTHGMVKAGTWFFFGPIWHTGQAVKALSLAYKYFGNTEYLEAAKSGADFIIHQQVRDKGSDDFGLIAAYEDHNNIINTSAILECVGGLFNLTDVTGNERYATCAIDAIQWVVRKLYKGNGLFTDGYDPVKKELSTQGWTDRFGVPGRPLIDDGVLFTAWQRTTDDKLRRIFYEVADLLLLKEDPPGNWINYIPSSWKKGTLHPRNGAFWWGRPMWMAYRSSRNEKYLQCFERSCDWYTKAMRHDGGMFRNTYLDFSTDSFGHATSAVGCACMMFHDNQVELGNSHYCRTPGARPQIHDIHADHPRDRPQHAGSYYRNRSAAGRQRHCFMVRPGFSNDLFCHLRLPGVIGYS